MMYQATQTSLAPVSRLPREVRALGLVSLLNDASSEMIYPLLPRFLTSVLGAGPILLGAIEGAAETTAAILKIASGWISDRMPRRKPLAVAGYALSSAARPLLALAIAPLHVLAIRIADRAGKGIRSAPRDALLAAITPAEQRGRAFGFHRAMDHAGALVGPLLAMLILAWREDLRLVFALAAVPALLCVTALAVGVRERAREQPSSRSRTTSAGERGPFTPVARRYLGVLALFTLGNSSDAFLLLRAQELGVGVAAIPLLWTWHHLVKAATSTAGGALSDRFGRIRTVGTGWFCYALTYAGFAFASRSFHAWLLFGAYALFHALTEGPERALAADLTAASHHGRYFGLFHAVTGVTLLPASLLTGFLWQRMGASVALGTGAALSLLAVVSLVILVPDPATRSHQSY